MQYTVRAVKRSWLQTEPYLTAKTKPPGAAESGEETADELLANENDKYEGYCADLAKQIARVIGFRYFIKPVKDKKYGAKENGTWNGMVGELIRHVRINCAHCFVR